MRKFISVLINNTKTKLELFIFFLIKKNYLFLAFYLSRVLKYIFLREFFISKKKNYNSLKQLVKLIKKNKTLVALNKKNENINLKNKKIIFLGPKKYNFKTNWLETAKNLKAKVLFIPTDDVSYIYSESNNSKNLKDFELKLIKKINFFKPNIIFMDVNFMGNNNTINLKTIEKINNLNRNKLKIVGWIGDIYSKAAYKIVKYWTKRIDLVLYGEPLAKNYIPKKNIKKLKYINYCVNEKLYFPEKKKNLVFFSGVSNISRYPYLIKLLKYSNKKKEFQIFFQSKYYRLSLSLRKYSQNMRKSKSVVNFVSRNIPYLRVLTGRSFEAIASKTLLIEERNDSISKLFVPYRDFIPFDSINELSTALNFVEHYPELSNKICNNAYNQYQNKYNSKYFWKKLFTYLDRR